MHHATIDLEVGAITLPPEVAGGEDGLCQSNLSPVAPPPRSHGPAAHVSAAPMVDHVSGPPVHAHEQLRASGSPLLSVIVSPFPHQRLHFGSDSFEDPLLLRCFSFSYVHLFPLLHVLSFFSRLVVQVR